MTNIETTPLLQPTNVFVATEEEKKTIFQTVFNAGKKVIDLSDDIWNLCRSFIAEKIITSVSPLLIGSVLFLIHLGEGYEAAKAAYRAYVDENTPQRKTKIAKSSAVMMIAGGGVGLCISYFVSGFGIEVLGASIFPVIIPALLTGIYVLNLMESLYSLSQVDIKKAEDDYVHALEEFEAEECAIRAELATILKRKLQLQTDLQKLIQEKKGNLTELFNLQDDLNAIEERIQDLQDNLQLSLNKLEAARANLIKTQEQLFLAERKVAFDVIEILGSVLVVTGIALSTAAFITLLATGSVATFGALPLALLIVGVAVGLAGKVFEIVDEKKEYQYTKGIREKLSHCFPFIRKLMPNNQKCVEPLQTQLLSTSKMVETLQANDVTSPSPDCAPSLTPAKEAEINVLPRAPSPAIVFEPMQGPAIAAAANLPFFSPSASPHGQHAQVDQEHQPEVAPPFIEPSWQKEYGSGTVSSRRL